MTTTPATAATARPTRIQSGSASGRTPSPRKGTSAMSGIAATSWKSRMPKALRPVGVSVSLRSASACSAMAVDESASASPPTSAARQPSPSSASAPPSTAPLAASWMVPPRNITLRIARKRRGSSSRPITKSMSTTPSSARFCVAATSPTKPSPQGPTTAPAMR